MLKENMIRGTGNTCIFFHNSYLSQCVLGGKHPSSTIYGKYNLYINLSPEIGNFGNVINESSQQREQSLLLLKNGNVGILTDVRRLPHISSATIGTTNPASTLTVVGNGSVSGAFSKGSGTFLIDHPLDPLNKKLQHSFAESPEMLNIYKGHNSTIKGKAIIEVPYWFNALNGYDIDSYEVVVSAYGKCGQLWADKNNLIRNYFEVYSDNDCSFAWVVYAVRHDAFALSHPVAVESEKSENEKGKCIHKEACERWEKLKNQTRLS